MVTINFNENTLTAFINGDIDHHNTMQLREEIDQAVKNRLPQSLKLDFRDVSFMDSSGIGLVMGRYKYLKTIGGKVFICNTSSYIKKVMKLAGLDKLVTFEN